MRKILMLASLGAAACRFAPPSDGGSASEPSAPLLDDSPTPRVAGEDPSPEIADASASPDSDPAQAPAATANPRTQARVGSKPKAAKAGARRRKATGPEKEGVRSTDIAAIVLQTSRVTGSDGRAIPRRSTVLTDSSRADALIERGWARQATEAEARSANIVLD